NLRAQARTRHPIGQTVAPYTDLAPAEDGRALLPSFECLVQLRRSHPEASALVHRALPAICPVRAITLIFSFAPLLQHLRALRHPWKAHAACPLQYPRQT